jgi:hypothetical protein
LTYSAYLRCNSAREEPSTAPCGERAFSRALGERDSEESADSPRGISTASSQEQIATLPQGDSSTALQEESAASAARDTPTPPRDWRGRNRSPRAARVLARGQPSLLEESARAERAHPRGESMPVWELAPPRRELARVERARPHGKSSPLRGENAGAAGRARARAERARPRARAEGARLRGESSPLLGENALRRERARAERTRPQGESAPARGELAPVRGELAPSRGRASRGRPALTERGPLSGENATPPWIEREYRESRVRSCWGRCFPARRGHDFLLVFLKSEGIS